LETQTIPLRLVKENRGVDVATPDLESKRIRIALAFQAYKTDVVRMTSTDLTGSSHIVATRAGMFAVNETSFRRIAHGFFFGITLREHVVYAFEACDMPRGPTRQGRIVRLTRRGDEIVEARVVAKGLDNGCHQIDFINGQLCVVDTYNQQVVRFSPDGTERETFSPLPEAPTGKWGKADPGYRHVNSLLAVEERILLLLHNGGAGHSGRTSEIALYDRNWCPLDRWKLGGRGCHGMAVLEDGTLLTCGSMAGEVISANGPGVKITPYMTRGLSVGTDSIVVGGSPLVGREERAGSAGTVTFMDRNFRVRSVLDLPAAPTEVRRLDGLDFSLSGYLQCAGWGGNLKAGTSGG
jgi:hypothetical protein